MAVLASEERDACIDLGVMETSAYMLIPWTPWRSWYLHNPDTWNDLEISVTAESHRDVTISGIFECWRFWLSREDRILKKSSQLNSLKLVVSRYLLYTPKF